MKKTYFIWFLPHNKTIHWLELSNYCPQQVFVERELEHHWKTLCSLWLAQGFLVVQHQIKPKPSISLSTFLLWFTEAAALDNYCSPFVTFKDSDSSLQTIPNWNMVFCDITHFLLFDTSRPFFFYVLDKENLSLSMSKYIQNIYVQIFTQNYEIMIQWIKIISFDFHHIPKLSIGFKFSVTVICLYLLCKINHFKIILLCPLLKWGGGGANFSKYWWFQTKQFTWLLEFIKLIKKSP